jgi:hypothetical protein
VIEGGVGAEHEREGCRRLDELMGMRYDAVRKKMRYAAHSCCFVCSVPGDWCPEYSRGRRCGRNDLVVPVCLTGWAVAELREVVKKVAGRGFRGWEERLEWLVCKCRVQDVKGTNALAVFDCIVGYLEDERRLSW